MADAGDDHERRVAHGRGIGGDLGVGAGPLQRRADAAEVARAVVGEHDLHARPFVERTPSPSGAHACRSAWASALNAASATWWSSTPEAETWSVIRALHREALECVREQGGGETADPIAGEGEVDLGVRPADEVDGRGRERLVHRHRGGAVAGDTGTVAQRVAERVAERGEDVLDRVVLVDVEVARREQLEVEPAVEGPERQQVVEEADPGRDARAARAVEVEQDPQRRLCARARDERSPAGRRAGRRAERSSRTSFSGGRRSEMRIPSGKARTTSPAASSRSASGSSVRTQTKLP